MQGKLRVRGDEVFIAGRRRPMVREVLDEVAAVTAALVSGLCACRLRASRAVNGYITNAITADAARSTAIDEVWSIADPARRRLVAGQQAPGIDKSLYRYTLNGCYRWTSVQLDLDLGEEDDIDALDAHLGERGLGIGDVVAAVAAVVPRRKGDRLYAYGRGLGGRPVVIVDAALWLGMAPADGLANG